MALTIYANDHAGMFPVVAGARTSAEALDALVPRYTVDTAVFICPGTKDPPLPAGESFRQQQDQLCLLHGPARGGCAAGADERPAGETRKSKAAGEYAFSSTGKPPGNNHGKLGGNFLFCDGRAEPTPPRVPFSLALTQGVVLLNPNPNEDPVLMRRQVCLRRYAGDGAEPGAVRLPRVRGGRSDFVNSMVRQELGPPGREPAAGARARAPGPRRRRPGPADARAVSARPAARGSRAGRLPTRRSAASSTRTNSWPTSATSVPSRICPKCMELFGYVCSPLCKGKAEAQGIAVPVYAGQKSVREARTWRRTVCGDHGGVLAGSGVRGCMVLVGVVWPPAEGDLVGQLRRARLFRPIRLLRQGPDYLPARGHPGPARHEAEEGNLVAPPGGQEGDRGRRRQGDERHAGRH